MLDAYIPEGALAPEVEKALLAEVTDILLLHEGADPKSPTARSIAWVFLHRPIVFVAGAPATEPRYRFICQVPEGQYDAERRQATTAAITAAVAKAEKGTHADVASRVWVFTHEIPDGNWGGYGITVRLPDIAAFVLGEAARPIAEQRLAERRHQNATALLELARKPVSAVPA
jgi:phenylpyruvate tautomerase PptA (4-oxalocrotonate tautomerase family)